MRLASSYMVSRQVQKLSSWLPLRCSASPAMERWNA